MTKAAARAKKAPARRLWSKEDIRLLKSVARKEPAAKLAKALRRTATRQKAKTERISISMTRKKRVPAKKH